MYQLDRIKQYGLLELYLKEELRLLKSLSQCAAVPSAFYEIENDLLTEVEARRRISESSVTILDTVYQKICERVADRRDRQLQERKLPGHQLMAEQIRLLNYARGLLRSAPITDPAETYRLLGIYGQMKCQTGDRGGLLDLQRAKDGASFSRDPDRVLQNQKRIWKFESSFKK